MTQRVPGLSRRRLLVAALGGAAGPRAWGAELELKFELHKRFIDEQPATPQVHASTLVELPDGSLMAAWFGGTAERAPDVRIWCSRLRAGAWSPPRAVADGVQPDGSPLPTWNPVLFQASAARGGKLLLFYKVGSDPRQ